MSSSVETRIIVEVELIKENAKKEDEENMLTVFCLFDSKTVLIHNILFNVIVVGYINGNIIH